MIITVFGPREKRAINPLLSLVFGQREKEGKKAVEPHAGTQHVQDRSITPAYTDLLLGFSLALDLVLRYFVYKTFAIKKLCNASPIHGESTQCKGMRKRATFVVR